MKRLLIAGACLVTAPSAVLGQYPVGYEFLVNVDTSGAQSNPAVASDDHGNFVVVWWAPDNGIVGRRFSAYGLPLGGEFLVVSHTDGSPLAPSVASSASGDFVVVWESYGQDGSQGGVFGQRFDAAGVPQGGAFQVNTYTTGHQLSADVAADGAGNFVVVWQSAQPYPAANDVFARRFDTSGAALGGEFRIHAATVGYFAEQTVPAVDVAAAGHFVVAWQHRQTLFGPHDPEIHAQRFDTAGVAQGSEFVVNASTGSPSNNPDVAVEDGGGFMVSWGASLGGFPIPDATVRARSFDADGDPRTGEFEVPAYTTGAHGSASIDVDRKGNFVVTWNGSGRDGDSSFEHNVFGRTFDAFGTPIGAEFRVNSYTTGRQAGPAVASTTDENFLVVWNSDGQDGSGLGVFGQLYGDLVFRDDFEAGDFSRWTFAQTDGGDLSVTGAAALGGTTAGLEAVVDDTAGLFVQDDTPDGEHRYRARFYFDPNGFDPGEANGRRRVRLFIGFDSSNRRVITLVLRRVEGAYSIQGRVRLSDGTRANTPFVPIGDGPHVLEVFWIRSGDPDVPDGVFRLYVDNVGMSTLAGLDNDLSPIDFVRLGALTVKPGASGTMFYDQFVSRRARYIGP